MLARCNAGPWAQSSAGSRAYAHFRTRACSSGVRPRVVRVQAEADSAGSSTEDLIHEVVELRGIRVSLEQTDPLVEYRVQWKDGSPDSWELASNISPDLIRDFDERWWSASKKKDYEALSTMLSYGREVLSQVVDENRRSALHFAAAVGATKCVKLLLDAGADPDLQDREGFTPLHMAAGYMQLDAMAVLLEAGADPELQDKEGRDVVTLVEKLRGQMPANPALLQRRLALEQVANALTDRLYDEVEVECILEEREGLDGEKEYLVQFQDGGLDAWLPERDIAPDLVEGWAAGLERAPVARLLDMQQFGTERQFLVQWADGSQDSWEPEERVPAPLVEALQEQRPDLFKQTGTKRGAKRRRRAAKAKQQQPQQGAVATQPAAAAASSSSSSSNGSHANGAAAHVVGSSSSVGSQEPSSSSSSSSEAGHAVAGQPAAADAVSSQQLHAAEAQRLDQAPNMAAAADRELLAAAGARKG